MRPAVDAIRTFALALALVACAGLAADERKPITPEIIAGLQYTWGAVLSPAGEHVADVLQVPRGADEEKGGSYSEIHVVPRRGGEPRQYTSKPLSSSSVQWAPDGKSLTFLSSRKAFDERRQIYRIPIDGGEARPLTKHGEDVGSYRWAPGGGRIAFLASDAESEERKKRREKGGDEIVRDRGHRYTRPWVFDVATGESRKVYERDLNAWSFVWSPDGTKLFVQATATPSIDESFMERRIYAVPASGGQPVIACETVGKLGAMAVSPDGARIAFAGAVNINDPLPQSVFVAPLAGEGAPRNLTPGTQSSVESLEWLDARTLLVLAHSDVHTVLFKLDVESGERQTVHGGEKIIHSLDVLPSAGLLAVTADDASHPSEVHVAELGSGKLKRLTTSNPVLETVRLARQEVVEWTARDGQRISGILTYPLDHDEGKRAPLVLQIHGGPEGVSLDGWRTRPVYPVQLLAARGFMVLEPNYRGSGGRGVAFSKADHGDLGGAEFDDVLAGIDALVHRGLVDRDRVGSGGWSYGGYFSAWAATRHSSRFRAAMMGAGIANWISFAGTTDIPHEMALVHWKSYWYDDPMLHWKRSPLAHIGNATTPTLIVHGLEDTRVHPGQALELYGALKHRGVATELVLYPREPHGLLERAHQIDFMERSAAWFEKYVK